MNMKDITARGARYGAYSLTVALMESVVRNQCEGGDTFSVSDAGDGFGYVVGGVTPALVVDVYTPPSDLALCIEEWLDRYGLAITLGNAHSVGWWEHNGKLYFDMNTHHTNRVNALAVARGRGQLAIWDQLNDEEITVS